MAKTYPDIGTFSPGDILTAATMNDVGTNLDNQRVPPALAVKKTGDQSSYTAGAAISWDAEDWDTDNAWASGTDITVGTTGLYLCSGQFYLTQTAGTYAIAEMYVGGTRTSYLTSNLFAISTVSAGSGSCVLSLTAGNVVTVRVDHNMSNVTVKGAAGLGVTQTRFEMQWLGQVS